MADKKKNKQEEKLAVNASFEDLIKIAVKDNPKEQKNIMIALNAYINSIQRGINTKPVTIRRYTFEDKLVNDSLVLNQGTKEDLKIAMDNLSKAKTLHTKNIRNQQFEEAITTREMVKEAQKELDKFIETATFKTGNAFALTETNDIVYTSAYLAKTYFKFDFLRS